MRRQFEPVQRRLRQALQTGAAEQALRTLVLKRKISGPTRSRRGVEFIARGHSAMESCHRQGRDLLDHLHGTVIARFDGMVIRLALALNVESTSSGRRFNRRAC